MYELPVCIAYIFIIIIIITKNPYAPYARVNQNNTSEEKVPMSFLWHQYIESQMKWVWFRNSFQKGWLTRMNYSSFKDWHTFWQL